MLDPPKGNTYHFALLMALHAGLGPKWERFTSMATLGRDPEVHARS